VYGVVKQSNGFIYLDSRPGEGAEFTIYLPEAGEARVAAREARVLATPGGSETLLLVEDEAIVREMTREIMEQHGYTVLVASTGAEALEVARRYDGEISLLLTDMVMPGMSGPELWEQVRQMRPETRVMFVSGYSDDQLVRGRGATRGDFMQKPFSTAALARKVREVLDRPNGPRRGGAGGPRLSGAQRGGGAR
jgi:CheY-like chemotaxis protein